MAYVMCEECEACFKGSIPVHRFRGQRCAGSPPEQPATTGERIIAAFLRSQYVTEGDYTVTHVEGVWTVVHAETGAFWLATPLCEGFLFTPMERES